MVPVLSSFRGSLQSLLETHEATAAVADELAELVRGGMYREAKHLAELVLGCVNRTLDEGRGPALIAALDPDNPHGVDYRKGFLVGFDGFDEDEMPDSPNGPLEAQTAFAAIHRWYVQHPGQPVPDELERRRQDLLSWGWILPEELRRMPDGALVVRYLGDDQADEGEVIA